MEIKHLQEKVRESSGASANPLNSPQEIMLALTEEVGEVAQEVALLERVGTKATWEKEPSTERLGKEISNTLNCLIGLANHYGIDLDKEAENTQ